MQAVAFIKTPVNMPLKLGFMSSRVARSNCHVKKGNKKCGASAKNPLLYAVN
ncbi:hypothetical protein TUM3792_06220 [Shewanella sp. MBTL60-007]|nr:hypothetical protein TUM3792_06220 [Shewanella sp. MBTL60-007]